MCFINVSIEFWNMKSNYFVVFIFALTIIGCFPVKEEVITEVTLDVTDNEFQKIYDYLDRQDMDSLMIYTSHNNASYRYIAAIGMASIQSENGLDSLYKLMYDPVMKVRTAAVYSIGQIGNSASTKELLDAFKAKDTLNVVNEYNASILEAIGKLGNANLLPSLATVSTYRKTDVVLLEGQARAIYNYGLRGITTSEGTDRMVQFLTEEGFPQSVKIIAANYLSHSKKLDLSGYKFRLAELLESSEDPSIRMALAIALGRTKDTEIYTVLKRQFEKEDDYRVKTNILRSYSNFRYITVVETIMNLLSDKNLQIANTAGDYLINHGISTDAAIYRDFINDSLHYNVQAKIYSSVLKYMPVHYTNTKNKIKKIILKKISNTDDPYVQAAYVRTLGYDPFNYKEILEASAESKHAIVRTTGAEAIVNILKSKIFNKAYRGRHKRIKKEILELIKTEIKKGDSGVSTTYGELLADESLGLKPLVEDPSFLADAMSKLQLPRETETYNSLNKAYSYLTDKKYTANTPNWNHPILWAVFNTYGDSIQAAFKTNKGVIRVELYAQSAPGSVANFISLAKEGYYRGKFVHRVVPNFVIQSGCPRGDGYGGENYSIRSELPQLYYDQEGYLGMASAGLHTEGTQWFITHSPAMHLSGKYTIFGKVISGMDVVHNIEVGDKIEDVIITKL